MIQANVRNISQEIRKAFDPLTGKEVAKIVAMAINSTLRKDRVMIGREIRKVYKMNTFDAKNEVPQVLANTKNLTGKLLGNAGFTPMEYFSISGKNMDTRQAFRLKRSPIKALNKNGKLVTVGRRTNVMGGGSAPSTFKVTIMAGKTTTFTHAFIANTKNGPMLMNRGNYNYRTTKLGAPSPRKPMTRLRTLSVWQEINSKGIRGKSEALLKKEYSLEYERLLNVQLTRAGWK